MYEYNSVISNIWIPGDRSPRAKENLTRPDLDRNITAHRIRNTSRILQQELILLRLKFQSRPEMYFVSRKKKKKKKKKRKKKDRF